MVRCEECGKKLGFWEGYRHPAMGKKHLVCWPCFERVEESVDRWREFLMANSFNKASSNSSLQSNWKNRLTDFIQIKKMVGNTGAKKIELYDNRNEDINVKKLPYSN